MAGRRVLCDRRGALWLPDFSALIVSDLHLEKASSFARRGVMLPPYDTAATLARLGQVIEDYHPQMVISLGDSFHDAKASDRMPHMFRVHLAALMAGRDWFWISGNHDPQPPAGLGGVFAAELTIGPFKLRHEPRGGQQEGEIAGHLHPGARIVRQGRSVRRPCFASDGTRLVMPAFGSLTGSLNVLDRAYETLFDWPSFKAHVLGTERIYALNRSVLYPD
ncbi:MAG: ligase-associated DNA damage response endonuclease PdeM [Mesorhizobium sp.]